MNHARTRRGFTIVELMLALSLAAVVLAAMIGVLGVLTGADAVSLKRIEQQTDLAVAQNLLRRSFVSLAAAAPLDPAAMLETLKRSKAAEAAEAETEPVTDEQQAARDQNDMGPMAPPDIAPMFEIYYTDLGDGSAAPALECVIVDPPGVLVPNLRAVTADTFRTIARGRTHEGARLSRRISQSVRGRFEVGMLLDGRWALQWRGLDPVSEPVTLLAGIKGLEWTALPIDEKRRTWQDEYSAKLATEFPIAVRLVVWTDDGQEIDWEFETDIQVISMQGDEPELPNVGGDDSADEGEDQDQEDGE